MFEVPRFRSRFQNTFEKIGHLRFSDRMRKAIMRISNLVSEVLVGLCHWSSDETNLLPLLFGTREVYLSTLWNIYVQIANVFVQRTCWLVSAIGPRMRLMYSPCYLAPEICICPHCEIYLSKLQMYFSEGGARVGWPLPLVLRWD